MEALGINPTLLIAQLINFLLLIFILRALLYRPVMNLLNERTKRIEESVRDAEKVREQLANAKRDYEAEIAKARQEAAKIVAQAQERAKQQEAEIIAQARREAERIKEEARAQAEQERARMMSEAKTQIADLVTLTASLVLGAELQARGHDALIAESLKALDRRN
ncbi:F0F1 ATP synthase subunit B [uncultured Chloroflexus sp.]|uniref:F0F1 ATP synthase subunit B n=1 Tax=uncultured Chloroflexus sp. TaxID=214040 RepID=UPI00262B890C|nr:F0F1 ATP synthase subunit B [uncultured Chloroflexus sp.]